MARSRQGVRSSRTGPIIRPIDRRRMKKLDREISWLDHAIRINEIVRPELAFRQKAKRDALDGNRRWLRRWMKGYVND